MVIDWNIYIISRQHSHRRPSIIEFCHIISWHQVPPHLVSLLKRLSVGNVSPSIENTVCLVFLFTVFCTGVHCLWVWLHKINITQNQGHSLFLSGRLQDCSKTTSLKCFLWLLRKKKRVLILKKRSITFSWQQCKVLPKSKGLVSSYCFLLGLASSPLSSMRAKGAFLLFS